MAALRRGGGAERTGRPVAANRSRAGIDPSGLIRRAAGPGLVRLDRKAAGVKKIKTEFF